MRDLHESFEHVAGSNSSGWINENKKELERFILKNFQLETKLLDSFCLNVKTFEKSKDTFLPEDAQQQMVKLKKFKALFNASQQANINKLILRVNQKEQGCVTRMEGYLRNLNDFSNLMACVQDAAGFLEMFIQKPDDRYRPLYHQRTRQLRNFLAHYMIFALPDTEFRKELFSVILKMMKFHYATDDTSLTYDSVLNELGPFVDFIQNQVNCSLPLTADARFFGC